MCMDWISFARVFLLNSGWFSCSVSEACNSSFDSYYFLMFSMKISELKNPVKATQQSARRHGPDARQRSVVASWTDRQTQQHSRQQTADSRQTAHSPESVLKSAFSINLQKNSKIKKTDGGIFTRNLGNSV